jgi:long-chain acyl-CoA synthetase
VPADINATIYGYINDFLAASIDRYRDGTAFISMGRTMSYGELNRQSRAFASHLRNAASLEQRAVTRETG